MIRPRLDVGRSAHWLFLGGLGMGLVFGPALAASGQEMEVDIRAPASARLGEEIGVTATVTDPSTGDPVRGARVLFYADGSIAGVTSDFIIGEASTNDEGVATLFHDLRVAGNHDVHVEVIGPDDSHLISVAIPVTVGGQLHQSEAGVDIPGLGGGLIVLILGTVWSVMFVATLWVLGMSRSSDSAPEDSHPERLPLAKRLFGRGGVSLATFISVAVFTLGSGIITLLIRSPDTHSNLEPEGYDRTVVAYVDAEYLYPGPGLNLVSLEEAEGIDDGRMLFMSKGCAGCHGVDAQGTATAPSPAGASPDWIEQVVRNGLVGMPSYSPAELTGGELDHIISFVRSSR